MEKSLHVMVIERKEVKGDDPIEYFLFTAVRSTSEKAMVDEVPRNKKISAGGENKERKRVGYAL